MKNPFILRIMFLFTHIISKNITDKKKKKKKKRKKGNHMLT